MVFEDFSGSLRVFFFKTLEGISSMILKIGEDFSGFFEDSPMILKVSGSCYRIFGSL